MRRLAVAAITAYQRYLSPLKGFSCAFRVHTGRDGCSGYGKRVIARYGVGVGLVLLKRRMAACGEVHHRHLPAQAPRGPSTARHRLQAGSCDLPCDAGDAGNLCDALGYAEECCSLNKNKRGCRNWFARWSHRRNDGEVVITPAPNPGRPPIRRRIQR
jgi:putative component of membrane protein insertase Oxa1/YidC/SpoIIIJ protein YidD